MTAAVTVGHGGPDAVEVRRDWPTPAPGPGEVLVEVAAAALNNTDVWSREGAYGTADDPGAVAGWRGVPLDFPLIQGGDIAGTVVAAGTGADPDLVGRRVIVDPAAGYEDGLPSRVVGSELDGGFAGYHVSAAERAHDVTGSPLSAAELACLPIAYGTALGMIERGGCRAGERVLVTGASGGVGLAAVQLLSARGCEVVALTTAMKAPVVREAGAVEIADREGDGVAAIAEVDAVLDVVGGEGFGTVLDRLATGGRLVTAGAIAGPVAAVDLRRVYLRRRTIAGSTMHTPEVFASLAGLAREGAVRPVVAATYPLTDIHRAQEAFAAKGFVGKIVLLPDDAAAA
ncbi:MAG: zinc-binding dehydrogenase [Actinobacteria bacterium]|nr:zinc-binding dehydrogenase [Actinomycetota bacterium]